MRTTEQELPVEQAVSAGGVVYRFGDDGLEVLLCGRIVDGLWALPKGTPEDNETLEETAAREVRHARLRARSGSDEPARRRPAQYAAHRHRRLRRPQSLTPRPRSS